MLKSKTVAKLIETTLNRNDKDEQFRVVYEVGSYKGTAINCILKQGKGTIRPIANYTNITTPFHIEIITPMQCGEDRLDTIVDVVNDTIKKLNGVVKTDIDGGKAVFLFSPLEIGNYETRATAGQSVLIKLEFSVEYSSNTGTKYEMALITNEFVGTIDTMYFENQADQVKWFDSKIETTNAQFNEVLVPNTNSMVITSQRYLNSNNVNINDLLMYNYAIIRETKSSGEINHYYYEITNSSLDQYNLLILDLKMDTLQTWYFNPNIKFDDCFISKADINRWIQDEHYPNKVRFDTRPESQLFERESIKDCTKRLVKREVLNGFGQNIYNGVKINEWISENVFGWYYVFLSSNALIPADSSSYSDAIYGKTAKLKPLSYARKQTEESGTIDLIVDSSLHNPIICLAFPVMNNRKKIYWGNVKTTTPETGDPYESIHGDVCELSNESLDYFLKNINPSYIYAMKFSKVSPFKYIDGYIVDENLVESKSGDLLLFGTEIENKFEIVTTDAGGVVNKTEHTYKSIKPRYLELGWEAEAFQMKSNIGNDVTNERVLGALNLLVQINVNSKIDYNLEDIQFVFDKSEIVDAEHDIKFNPKLLSSDYMGLLLSDSLQNGSEYDILKIGKNDLEISYTEALTPDVSRRYIRFSNLDGYYIPETSENLTGYVVVDDASITLEGTQYQSMLANNKNFFLQNTVDKGFNATNTLSGIAMGAVGTIIGGVMGGIPGLVTGVVSNVVSAGSNLISNKMSNQRTDINESLTVDNLKNAPNSINGAKGNTIFNAMYSDMGVVVERHEILPNEKQMVDNDIVLYGMTVNKVLNIKEYDNIRRYHNYIMANIQGIKGVSLSNAIQDDIRQRFANGVRFWNADKDGKYNVSYKKENYERWLEA